MKPRNVLLSLFLVLAIMSWAVWRSRLEPKAKEAVRRHPAKLAFTPAALCQLRCMGAANADAINVLAEGWVLFHKSHRRAAPCPVWVVQGKSKTGLPLRIWLEQCAGRTLVLRCERLGQAQKCSCPQEPLPPPDKPGA